VFLSLLLTLCYLEFCFCTCYWHSAIWNSVSVSNIDTLVSGVLFLSLLLTLCCLEFCFCPCYCHSFICSSVSVPIIDTAICSSVSVPIIDDLWSGVLFLSLLLTLCDVEFCFFPYYWHSAIWSSVSIQIHTASHAPSHLVFMIESFHFAGWRFLVICSLLACH